MPLQTFIIGLVLISMLLLFALLYWRFYGSGKAVTNKVSLPDLNRHSTLRMYRYDVGNFVKPVNPKPERPTESPPENIIQKLVDNTNKRAANKEKNTTTQTELFPKKERKETINHPGSIGESDEVLFPEIGPQKDKLVKSHPDTALRNSENPEDEQDTIAPSLFHNVVTAPACTDNDIKNRQAASEHRSRKGSALRAKLTNQKEAIGDLFIGKPTVVKPAGDPENENS